MSVSGEHVFVLRVSMTGECERRCMRGGGGVDGPWC
jgi:hypothetical protein